MQYVLFEDVSHQDLLPLTFTRPIMDLRVGILKLHEKWEHYLHASVGMLTFGHLSAKFCTPIRPDETLFINGKFLPDAAYVQMLLQACHPAEALVNAANEVLAVRSSPAIVGNSSQGFSAKALEEKGLRIVKAEGNLPEAIRFPWDIFRLNRQEIVSDIEIFRTQRASEGIIDPHTIVYGRDNIFVEPGVKIKAAILNAEDGPIYLGQGAEIQEGAIIHGAHAICAHATVNMGAKLRGDTTVGPWSKVGGEVANSVLQGYSNKGHDGYLGNSVLGYWCNLGADTNTSNLKNNYAEVRVWNYPKRSFVRTGQMFCGLIMGDHSKCGINTMFNTGTVVGVSANVFGDGYPRNFIPSFSWGGAAGFSTFALKKAFEVAEIVMGRRKLLLEDDEREILKHIFEQSAEFRTWERESASE